MDILYPLKCAVKGYMKKNCDDHNMILYDIVKMLHIKFFMDCWKMQQLQG
jgi:hypothetical protein